MSEMDEFSRDLAENLTAIDEARGALLAQIRGLSPEDLRRVRRGGWSVQEVLRHVIDSEVAYTKVVGFLRSKPADLSNASGDDVSSGPAAGEALERTRQAVMSLLAGMDENTFYELRALGKEQYSVVSVLENVA